MYKPIMPAGILYENLCGGILGRTGKFLNAACRRAIPERQSERVCNRGVRRNARVAYRRKGMRPARIDGAHFGTMKTARRRRRWGDSFSWRRQLHLKDKSICETPAGPRLPLKRRRRP